MTLIPETCCTNYRPRKTRTLRNTINPVWEETFEFKPIVTKVAGIQIQIMHAANVWGDSCIGTINIPLAKLLDQQLSESWYSLHGNKCKTTTTALIQTQFKYSKVRLASLIMRMC